MTGTASGMGGTFMDFDSYKNQEWLRRRKLRLEQVRKQSNEIAKALRQKVIDGEKARLDEYEKISAANIRDWKAEKLAELEWKLRSALEEFGESHRQAEEESEQEEIIKEKNNINLAKAQRRSEIAHQEELKKKKMAEEERMLPIQRKQMARKKEDLRSALVCSLPLKKQFIDIGHSLPLKKEFTDTGHSMPLKKQVIDTGHSSPLKKQLIDTGHSSPLKKQLTDTGHSLPLKKQLIDTGHSLPLKKQLVDTGDVYKEKVSSEKVMPKEELEPVKKLKQKRTTFHKTCLCKSKPPSTNYLSKAPETVWVNLNEIQTCETSDSGLNLRMSKSSISNGKSQNEKPEGTVEFYDFSSRYHSKTFKEFPHLVERIDLESEVPNANELAQIEEKKAEEEVKKKMEVDVVSQERGMEALRREKIQREYNNLIAKLEELNKKEKILKAQQRNAPSFFHMNDERLSERARNKQRMMDAKFESIYFEAAARLPQSEPLRPFTTLSRGGGDYAQFDDEQSVRLSLSPSRPNLNTPVLSQEESSLSDYFEENSRQIRKTNEKEQLLLSIDRALKVGRELRRTASKNWKSKDFEGAEETQNEDSGSNSKTSEAPPPKDEVKMKTQESQTDNIKEIELKDEKEELKCSDKTGEESLAISSATSYKSPPSVIRSYRLREFLSSLEKQDSDQLEDNQDQLLDHPTLEYYIEKLLSMSRECIAELSVSSENISTPNITDFDVKDEKTSVLSTSSREKDLIRKSTLNRASQLEETMKNWKKILEKNSEKALSSTENFRDSTQYPKLKGAEAADKSAEEPSTARCPNVTSKYEEITKKCSERILELSDMLNKVRKDKEKLLSSTSGGSTLSLNKEDERMLEKELVEVEEDTTTETIKNYLDQHKAPPVFESFICRFNSEKPVKEPAQTTAMENPQSFTGPEESLDSWPDVMDELLKKEILTSPFKWSDGEHSSEFTKITDTDFPMKPSSIESVIGNFRKEIKNIKPFSLSNSFPRWNSQVNSTLRHSFDEGNRPKSFLDPATETGSQLHEESSVESINNALTSLGLNWAKSFLRKNEESRAMSSSSNSTDKSSGDEKDDFY